MFVFNTRSAALQTGKCNNLFDHLVPLAYLMNSPLIVNDRSNASFVQKFYPQVPSYYIPDLSLNFLLDHFEVIYECQARSHPLHRMARDFYQKTLRTVFAPHGNSDKGFSAPKNFFYHFTKNDITLIYGNHMIDALKHLGYWDHIKNPVVIGNYRYLFYQELQSFYDALAEKEIFSRLPKKNKTILYAPTWKDVENSTSFFREGKKIIDDLPDQYNLIIKVHPNLENRDPHLFYPLAGYIEKKKKKNLLLIETFPVVFPILSKVDIYLGDFSSVGYDMLLFKKPMFFLDIHHRPKTHKSLFLHKCGITIPLSLKGNIFSFMEKNLDCWPKDFEEIQETTYRYAFSEISSFKEAQKNILTTLSSDTPMGEG
ncbi:MAG: CDP-glycerol glycerophosphotransferase family protein [Parachlamydiales bacterium]|nr:CDP-glycerol glycerophosphotransferase family protein [Parachlamydiales bacterium]